MANGNRRDLIIGFDFGTSASKVVVRDHSLSRAHAIPFQGLAHPSNPYLLPSELMLSKTGEFLLKCDDPAVVFRRLKVHLLDSVAKYITVNGQEVEIKPAYLAAIYIALALKQVRERFLEKNREVYRYLAPFWQLNIGLPAKNYDEATVREHFLNAAKIGWWLSERKEALGLSTLETLDTAKARAIAAPGIHPDNINVIPEIAAQVAGYARSRLRQEGLHVLLDIGAMTVDVAAFRLSKTDGEDVYRFMTADVHRCGCQELHAWRAARVTECLSQWMREMACACDLVAAIPDSLEPYCPQPKHLPNIDNEFLEVATTPLSSVVARTKVSRDPFASEWANGLPLFLCGGGSKMAFYNERVVSNANYRLRDTGWAGFRETVLPKPDYLVAESLKAGEFHRRSVAEGLSHPVEDIGRIVPESEIGDVRIVRSGKVFEYISKDQV